LVHSAEREVNNYIEQLQSLYFDAAEQLKLQKDFLDELNKYKLNRPSIIDDSFESFRKAYNESMEYLRLNTLKNINKQMSSTFYEWDKSNVQFPSISEYPYGERLRQLNENLTKHWDNVVDLTKGGTSNAERKLKHFLTEMQLVRENVTTRARALTEASQIRITESLTKREVQRERYTLEEQLKRLEIDSRQWMGSRINQLESAVKSVQDKLSTSNRVYEELIARKSTGLYYRCSYDNMSLNGGLLC